jgi:hypothetical protein
MRFAIIILLVVSPSLIQADTLKSRAEGIIDTIIFNTEAGHFKRKGYVQFQIKEAETGPDCTFLYLTPEDEIIIKAMVTAYVNKLNIIVFFDPDDTAPWGIGSCKIKSLNFERTS